MPFRITSLQSTASHKHVSKEPSQQFREAATITLVQTEIFQQLLVCLVTFQ